MIDSTILIVGLGQIGGSIAKALKGKVRSVLGVDINLNTLNLALSEGIISEGFTDPDSVLKRTDVIFLCLYPQGIMDFLDKYANFITEATIITDVAGVKSPITTMCSSLDKKISYIGGHPLAGREGDGFGTANSEIFKDANYVITPSENVSDEQISLITTLIYAMGFKLVLTTTPDNHDEIIAYTSQIPHIIAVSMCDTPMLMRYFNYTAGSFEDVTRVAKINERLWTDLFLQNKEKLVPQMDLLEKNIAKIKNLITNDDTNGLIELFGRVRAQKELSDSAKNNCGSSE